jgi:photosystem II stability/assembly factor-like uncharacterized protein
VNNNLGWISGTNGQIARTTNKGLNWVNQVSGTGYNLNNVRFLNSNTGFITADSGQLLVTSNGGNNWTISVPYQIYSLKDIYFINGLTGFIIGNKLHTTGTYWGTYIIVLKTTNMGLNWEPVYSGEVGMIYPDLNSIYFVNINTGLVTTNVSGLLVTTNTGLNWFSVSLPTNDHYKTSFFINDETGWVAGGYGSTYSGGTVLTSGNFPIGIKDIGLRIPKSFSLTQNYPNPFNPITKIKFDIPNSPLYERGAGGFVTLIIYDILGREVATLVNEQLKPGTYEYEWNGSNFASGIYFYKLETEDFSQTRKMVLIK